MTEDGLKSVIVKVGLTALVLACVGGVRGEPSNNRNTTVQVVEAADEGAFHVVGDALFGFFIRQTLCFPEDREHFLRRE